MAAAFLLFDDDITVLPAAELAVGDDVVSDI